jgi:hypothetical protein
LRQGEPGPAGKTGSRLDLLPSFLRERPKLLGKQMEEEPLNSQGYVNAVETFPARPRRPSKAHDGEDRDALHASTTSGRLRRSDAGAGGNDDPGHVAAVFFSRNRGQVDSLLTVVG